MITFLIRCKNEAQWIGHSIQSVLDNFLDPEIIVLDNNSTDESLEIVNMFKKWNNIKIKNIEDYSPGKSINTGVELSSNDYIFVMSAHCELQKCTPSKELFDLLEEYAAVFFKQIPIYKGKKITPRYIWSHFGDEEVVNMYSSIENRYFLHNALALYKKDFLLKYPFDPSYHGKEDRYWAADIVKKGHNFLYTPKHIQAKHFYTNNGATWKGLG